MIRPRNCVTGIALVLITVCCGLCFAVEPTVPPDGEQKGYYPNGHIEYIVTYKNGLRNGPSKSFYENGDPKTEFYYKNSVQDGVQKWFREGGIPRQEQAFREGKPHGLSREFYEDGVLWVEGKHENGIRVYLKDYDENGNSKSYTEFYPNQKFKRQDLFGFDTAGRERAVRSYFYDEQGNLQIEEKYDPKTDKVYQYQYDQQKRLIKESYYKDYLYVTLKEYSYHDNGKKKSLKEYDGTGRLILEKTFDESGQLISGVKQKL